MTEYRIFYLIWLVEIAIGIAMFVLLILGKMLYEAKMVRSRRIAKRLQENLFLLMTKQREIKDIDWGNEVMPRDTLLDTLESYHANFQDENWNRVENFLVTRYLLPWARHHVNAKLWKNRNHVVRIFLLRTEEQDAPHLLRLMEDKSFYIRMVAAEALGELKIQEVIEPLLRRMAREPRSCRFIYRHVLLKTSFEYSPELLRIYHSADSQQLRLCCLDILSYRYYGNIFTDIQPDFDSENSSIRFRIAKILTNIATRESTEKLTEYLQDPEPRIREEALRGLGQIRNPETVEKVVPMLKDPIYEVRLEAAKTLMQFKKEGRRVLESQDWDINPLAYEVARFVLTS